MHSRLAAWWRSLVRLGVVAALATCLPIPFATARPAARVSKPPAVEAGSVRFTRSYGWLPVDARRLVLWAGIEEPYLVDLAPGCNSLSEARVSGFSTHNRRLSPRTDSFVVDGNPCPVERIQPAGGGTLKSLGLRREDARPVPILPAALPVANPSPPPPRKTP